MHTETSCFMLIAFSYVFYIFSLLYICFSSDDWYYVMFRPVGTSLLLGMFSDA